MKEKPPIKQSNYFFNMVKPKSKVKKQCKFYRHIEIKLTFWQRLKILFGATPTVAIEWNDKTLEVKNLGTIL